MLYRGISAYISIFNQKITSDNISLSEVIISYAKINGKYVVL